MYVCTVCTYSRRMFSNGATTVHSTYRHIHTHPKLLFAVHAVYCTKDTVPSVCRSWISDCCGALELVLTCAVTLSELCTVIIWLGLTAKLTALQCITSDVIECVSGWWWVTSTMIISQKCAFACIHCTCSM